MRLSGSRNTITAPNSVHMPGTAGVRWPRATPGPRLCGSRSASSHAATAARTASRCMRGTEYSLEKKSYGGQRGPPDWARRSARCQQPGSVPPRRLP
eukprot:354853-Chlamydomonas_euryale.AAC.4